MKSQDGGICGPKGWDCIEENTSKNFSCGVTCQGIHADVQTLKNQMTKSSGSEYYNTDDKKLKLKATNGGEEQEEDNKKVSRLVKQYNEFKKKNLPNFFFNPEKGTEQFGKFKTFQTLLACLVLTAQMKWKIPTKYISPKK